MYCDDFKKLMIEYFDTGLNNEKNSLLTKHLEVCDSCKAEFEELKTLFATLEKENQTLLVESERYIQSIEVDEVLSNKIRKKKWYEFQLKPSFAFAVIVLISLIVYYGLTSVNFLNKKNIVENETLNETGTIDFLSDYLNQDYIYENIDETSLPQSDYFKDVINFIDELSYSTINNLDMLTEDNSSIINLDEKEIDELIAQLENKKFLGE